MVAQITEGGGELSVFMEGVLIDTQHQWTIQREPFTGFSLRKLPIDAGYGGWSDLFEPARGGTWDALMVEGVDVFSEGLRRMFAWKDARELLEKGTFTVAASEAAAANAQAGGIPKALHMTNPPLISAFTLDAGTTAASAARRPFLWG